MKPWNRAATTAALLATLGLAVMAWSNVPSLGESPTANELPAAVTPATERGTIGRLAAMCSPSTDTRLVRQSELAIVTDARARTAVLEATVERLSGRLVSLERQLAQLSGAMGDLHRTQRAARTALDSDDPLEDTLAMDEEARAQLRRQAAEERRQFLEHEVLAEHVDPEWAKATTDAIDVTFLDGRLAGTAVHDVDCRQTLCQVVVSHDNVEAFDAFQSVFLEAISDVLPTISIVQTELGGQASETVLYMARDGYGVPSPPIVE